MLAIVCSDKWGHNFGTLPRADGTPYATEKGAFRNHPCTIWANEFVITGSGCLLMDLLCVMSILLVMVRFIPAQKTLLAAKEILPTADPQGR